MVRRSSPAASIPETSYRKRKVGSCEKRTQVSGGHAEKKKTLRVLWKKIAASAETQLHEAERGEPWSQKTKNSFDLKSRNGLDTPRGGYFKAKGAISRLWWSHYKLRSGTREGVLNMGKKERSKYTLSAGRKLNERIFWGGSNLWLLGGVGGRHGKIGGGK